jgi:Leucine-rich repeat (LRR) protein
LTPHQQQDQQLDLVHRLLLYADPSSAYGLELLCAFHRTSSEGRAAVLSNIKNVRLNSPSSSLSDAHVVRLLAAAEQATALMLDGSQIAGLLDALHQQLRQQQLAQLVVGYESGVSGLEAAFDHGLTVSRGVDSCSTTHTATTANTSNSSSSSRHRSKLDAASTAHDEAPGTVTPASHCLRSVIVGGVLTETTASQLVQLLDALPCAQRLQYLVLQRGCGERGREAWLPDQDAWAVAGGLPWPPGPFEAALAGGAPVGNSACSATSTACSSRNSGGGGADGRSTMPMGAGAAPVSVSSWRSSLHTVLVEGCTWDNPNNYMRLLGTVLGPLQQLQVLYVRNAPVVGLQPLASSLRSLRVLHVDCESLEGADMMEAAAQLTGLRHLKIVPAWCCPFSTPRTAILSAFSNMQHLTSLQIAVTPISSEGLEVLCSISSLRELHPHGNTGEPCLPDCASRLMQLESLELCDTSVCSLSNISAALTGLRELVWTTASDTGAIQADAVGCMINLQHLTIKSEQHGSLPDSISQLGRLEYLRANCVALPPSSSALTRLRELHWSDYAGTGAVQLQLVGGLTGLQHLTLSHTSGDVLPDSMSQLVHLESVDLRDTHVVRLPDSMAALTGLSNLVWCNVASSQALQLESIGQLRGLQHLIIKDHCSHSVPAAFSQLTKLTELWVEAGWLVEQPCVLSTLVSLERLAFYAQGLDSSQLRENLRVLASLKCTHTGTEPGPLFW